MSRGLQVTFLIHAAVALAFGLPLLLAPGRWLTMWGWAPIDPILSRLLGAALLALAWSSFRGWRATAWAQVAIVVELEAVFTVLGCLGLLRHLLVANYPMTVWLLFVVLLAFAIAWSFFLFSRRSPSHH
jgi:hypothetical protein